MALARAQQTAWPDQRLPGALCEDGKRGAQGPAHAEGCHAG